MAVGSLGAGVLLQSCENKETVKVAEPGNAFTIDRTTEELKREKQLMSEKFFDDHEMKTIIILSDIIIPKDDKSGSASEAGVPAFIEFIVKDMPHHQVPMRGGLKWLDLQCMRRHNKSFADLDADEQIAIVDEIAYPETAKPEMQPGVAFFNRMRDLTATGFFTSKMGIEDLGYMGNRPNQWDGVPQDVLDQYGLKYDEKTLEISVKFNA